MQIINIIIWIFMLVGVLLLIVSNLLLSKVERSFPKIASQKHWNVVALIILLALAANLIYVQPHIKQYYTLVAYIAATLFLGFNIYILVIAHLIHHIVQQLPNHINQDKK
jgi:hypothetical protein